MKTLNEISIKLAGNYVKAATSKIKDLVRGGRGTNLAAIRKRSAGVSKAKNIIVSKAEKNTLDNVYHLSTKAFDISKRYGEELENRSNRDNTLPWGRGSAAPTVLHIVTVDPSEESLEFLVKTYIKKEWNFDDADKIKDNLRSFGVIKQTLTKKDINQYQSIKELQAEVEGKYIPPSKKYLVKMAKMAGTQILIDSPDFKVIRLFKHDAVKYYCAGTRWCLTDTGHFANYTNNDANLIVIIAKIGDKFEKFAWHMNSMTITDAQDHILSQSTFKGLSSFPQWGALENYFIHHSTPEVIVDYIDRLGLKQLKEAEPKLAQNAYAASRYASDALEKRFLAGEPAIARDPTAAVNYNIQFGTTLGIGLIAKNASTALRWALYTKKRFLRGEKAILERKSAPLALSYVKEVVRGKWPEGEEVIAQDPEYAFDYAKLTGRFPLGEKILSRSTWYSMKYAREVLHGRFPAGEKVLSQDADMAIEYAEDIIKGRWKAGEAAILQNPKTIPRYVSEVLKHPWKEGERALLRSRYNSAVQSYGEFLYFNGFKAFDEFAKSAKEKTGIDLLRYYNGIRRNIMNDEPL